MQKTAYELRISYWSSDVCSSDLRDDVGGPAKAAMPEPGFREAIVAMRFDERADCIEVAALRGGREGERNRPETEVEQSVAERRLAVIVAPWRSARDDLDLALI